MRVYVGTSGWLYDWNRGRSLSWYVEHSGLNAVELNASFYRFPSRRQAESWAKRGTRLRWSIKVHRVVTHVRRLNEKALEAWRRFREIFAPLEERGLVDFYLLQLPPSYDNRPAYAERLRSFAEAAGLGERLAIEFRHASWLETGEGLQLCRELGATFVSIDAPIGCYVARSGRYVYLRLHGRTVWYGHDYSREELEELARRVASLRPEAAYVFFNNDHWMLDNARKMMEILSAYATGEKRVGDGEA